MQDGHAAPDAIVAAGADQQPSPGPAAAPAGAGGPGSDTTAAETPETVRQQRDEYYDRLLRQAAEFDNYRKRIERERKDFVDFAAAEMIRELLPLVDNFDRALRTEASGAGSDALRRGIELIHKQLVDLLARRGVAVIDPLGDDFDPHLHEAVTTEPSQGAREGEVVAVLSKGYKLGDRLLRPAMVKVAAA